VNEILKTDLTGLVQSLPPFKHEALLPVCETVVNAIQAIHEAKIDNGEIIIKINRVPQLHLKITENDSESKKHIIGFDIEDNGIGFDDINYESFKTNHSTHKLDLGCKGIGRFIWLKAFDKVEIDSNYRTDNNLSNRKIYFNLKNGITASHGNTQGKRKTTVRLQGFKKEYRDAQTAYKKGLTIAQRIFEHCLSYYIINHAPSIFVIDGDARYNFDEFYKTISNDKVIENMQIDNIEFQLIHLKLYNSQNKLHNIVLCGNSRKVCEEKLSNYIGINAEFDEHGKKFIYSVYVTSKYLDNNVDSLRLQFLFPDKNDLFSKFVENDYPVTKEQIILSIVPRVKEFLKDYLEIITKQKKDLVTRYVSNVNPTLRAVPIYLPRNF
jgi:hypothetical protein